MKYTGAYEVALLPVARSPMPTRADSADPRGRVWPEQSPSATDAVPPDGGLRGTCSVNIRSKDWGRRTLGFKECLVVLDLAPAGESGSGVGPPTLQVFDGTSRIR